jgi:hypothetical protein
VIEEHESALMELCTDPMLDGADTEQCFWDFLKDGYNFSADVDEEGDLAGEGDGQARIGFNPVGEEDLVHNIHHMWAADLPVSPYLSGLSTENEEKQAKVIKPWSSRSSPSGTFVRDPKTGRMRNIEG